MPGRIERHFSPKAVLLFMEPEIDEYVAAHHCEEVGKFECVTKIFYAYKTKVQDTEVTFVQVPLGGAGAVQIMEQVIAGGAKQIIAAGCCGALEDGMEGEFFVPTAALRQEGTSYHFTADSLANVDEHDGRNWGNDTFAAAMELALDAVTLL